jgi:IS605 OrfB family transposase
VTRTVKWLSSILNTGKWATVLAIATAYSLQKDAFLRTLARTVRWADLDKPRAFRNRDKESRVNLWKLPVHLYDRALFDAVDTMRRWILAAIDQAHIEGKLFRAFEGPQRRYAFWLLRKFVRIGAALRGEAPEPKFEISLAQRQAVVRLLRRLLRKALGKSPRVHLRRSFELDNTLYRFFTHRGKPYLSIASLVPGQRTVIPLKGFPVPAVTGNVRVVLDPRKHAVAVHVPVPVRVKTLPDRREPVVVGLDAGVTEVFADSRGNFYGEGFGLVLDRLSARTTAQGAERNRLHAAEKKLAAASQAGERQKAGRIRRFNLGRVKLDARRARGQAEVKRRISEALREVLRFRPDVLVMEDLSRMRGRTKSRNLSRVVSRWMRSSLKERAEFLSQAGGSRLETVNAAYTSQECPKCGYVHRDNRQGDRFHCRDCHFTGHADTVGAVNVERRHTDPELRERIQVFTPKEVVLKSLREIFERKRALST